MKAHYLDSSAWIKRYFREDGSEGIASLFAEDAALTCSRLAIVEVIAGVVRRARHEGISEPLIQTQVGKIRHDATGIALIELSPPIMSAAEDMAARHGLRGSDAVHLASAISYRAGHSDDELVLVSSDLELLAAARKEGLTVLDPQRP